MSWLWHILIENEKALSLTNKHDFYSTLFSKILICYQLPKQPETWDSSIASATKDLTKNIELLIKKCVIIGVKIPAFMGSKAEQMFALMNRWLKYVYIFKSLIWYMYITFMKLNNFHLCILLRNRSRIYKYSNHGDTPHNNSNKLHKSSPSIETHLAVVRGLPTKKFLPECVNEKSSTERRS